MIKHVCFRCGNDLVAYETFSRLHNKDVVSVQPCEKCLRLSYLEGMQDQKEHKTRLDQEKKGCLNK